MLELDVCIVDVLCDGKHTHFVAQACVTNSVLKCLLSEEQPDARRQVQVGVKKKRPARVAPESFLQYPMLPAQRMARVCQAGESEFSSTCSKTISEPTHQARKSAGSGLQIRESDLRVLVITSTQDEIARCVNSASMENMCATISCLTQEVEGRGQRIVKIVVQSNHLRERLTPKALFVANMCGKIVHANAMHIHTPAIKPYVGRESNNFGTTESVYTKVCNFHTGLQNTTTLLRAGTSSREIERAIPHVFVMDNIVEAVVHNIVYSARIGRPVSAQNKAIGRALEEACGCRILACLQIEESMFVHSFHVQMDRASSLRGDAVADAPDINVRINICRTGVVNLFVGVPGGIPLRLEPEMKLMPVCAALLEAIVRAT